MKVHVKITALLLLFVVSISCDEIDELTEIDIEDNISATVSVDVADNQGAASSFTRTATLNLASNQEISDNLDLVQNVVVNSISYEITDFTGASNATISNASIAFGSTIISVSDLNLEQADANNSIYSITNAADLAAISNALEASSILTVVVSAGIDTTPATFNVDVIMDVTVTIDVL